MSERKARGKVAARVEVVVTFRAEDVATKELAGRACDAGVEFLDIA